MVDVFWSHKAVFLALKMVIEILPSHFCILLMRGCQNSHLESKPARAASVSGLKDCEPSQQSSRYEFTHEIQSGCCCNIYTQKAEMKANESMSRCSSVCNVTPLFEVALPNLLIGVDFIFTELSYAVYCMCVKYLVLSLVILHLAGSNFTGKCSVFLSVFCHLSSFLPTSCWPAPLVAHG